jgi:hypothetical protein
LAAGSTEALKLKQRQGVALIVHGTYFSKTLEAAKKFACCIETSQRK